MNKHQEMAKQAVKLDVHRCGGGVSTEELTGLDTTYLSRWANEDQPDHQIKLWQFLLLDEASGYAGLKSIARKCGLDIVTKEQREAIIGNATKLAVMSMHASTDLHAAALEAMADGEVTETEYRGVVAKHEKKHEVDDALVNAVGALRLVKKAS